MSRRCDVCGVAPKKAASRSHSKIQTLRKQYPNLQAKTVDGQLFKLCTSCIRTFNSKGHLPKRATV